MTITRRALLISNPGETGAKNYCKGVFRDVDNYRRLFRSPHGGWWSEDEITHLDRPSVVQVRDAVKAISPYDYTFIAFSGHGWYSSVHRDTILTLREGQQIASLELLEGAQKRTLALDCCREVYNEALVLSNRMKYAALSEDVRRQINAARCRETFFAQVHSASRGVVVLHSCSVDETAGDDETLGGRYTSGLISSGDRWADAEAERYHPSPTSLSIVEAHESAAADTKRRSGGTQNPSIEKPRTERNYFPFAVFAS